MSKTIPKRSIAGCLTCKRRKKKCDERRPRCRRCELSDFDCLGYIMPEASHTAELSSTAVFWPSHAAVGGTTCLGSLNSPISLPDGGIMFQGAKAPLSGVPRGILLDPLMLEDATTLIVSQYVKLSQVAMFRAPLLSLERGISRRISESNITRWSMYLGARVIADLLSDTNVQKYLGWIFRFCQQITETPASNELERSLHGRLNGLYDLICLGSMISGSATGYSLFQRSTSVFLRLAALHPKIWVDDSSISVPEAFRGSPYEAIQFVVHDTLTALALGTFPQLQYDTTSLWVDGAAGHYMEWIYGFPVGAIILLAKVNAWRTSRMTGAVNQSQSSHHNTGGRLNSWSPIVDHTDDPRNNVARVAVQEAWRQAALIYLYMGMSEVNSADPRVARAMRQVFQLGNIITKGSPFELHLLIPSLIAGVAARQEKHRAALRSKVASELFRKINPLVLPVRGSDFIAVLDHLWHGVGAGGNPVTWDDYVRSRCIALPLHHEH